MKERLLVATGNGHKAREIGAILGLECLSLKELEGAPSVREDAGGFAGNARLKAEGLVRWISARRDLLEDLVGEQGCLVLADDSGLEVDALNGAPGVHSARFAAGDPGGEGNTPDAENNAKLLRLMAGVPRDQRTARFRCVIALMRLGDDSGRVELFDGTCEGLIEEAPRGEGGFGYDPLFIPLGQEKSFAELGDADKNRISHRARALEALRTHLEARVAGSPG